MPEAIDRATSSSWYPYAIIWSMKASILLVGLLGAILAGCATEPGPTSGSGEGTVKATADEGGVVPGLPFGTEAQVFGPWSGACTPYGCRSDLFRICRALRARATCASSQSSAECCTVNYFEFDTTPGS